MKMASFHLGAALSALLLSPPAAANEDELKSFTDDARRLAAQITTQVRGEMVKEVERSGPIRAINVCKYSAPEIASSIARQSGMRVSRVALRPRNRALGDPDPWEQKVLLDFEKRLAKGESGERLEFTETVQEPAGKSLRYMKAIIMAQPCMVCHGPSNQIPEAVRVQLVAEYPHDKAVEYQIGQLRGGVSVKKSY